MLGGAKGMFTRVCARPCTGPHIQIWENGCWEKMELCRRGKNNEKEAKKSLRQWSKNTPLRGSKINIFLTLGGRDTPSTGPGTLQTFFQLERHPHLRAKIQRSTQIYCAPPIFGARWSATKFSRASISKILVKRYVKQLSKPGLLNHSIRALCQVEQKVRLPTSVHVPDHNLTGCLNFVQLYLLISALM